MLTILLAWLHWLLQPLQRLQKRWFATYCNSLVVSYNRLAIVHKETLFEHLNEQICSHNSSSSQPFKLLEVGGGSGANFDFIKNKTDWTVVEPNIEFAPFFKANKSKADKHLNHDIKELVEAYGEDMRVFPDNSFDAAIITKVLCSATQVDQVLSEIKRVLKPGGHFYYIEHVIGPRGSLQRLVQHILTKSGVWPFIFEGCSLNKDIAGNILRAGFQSVEQVHYQLTDEWSHWPYASHLRGRAQK